MKKTCVSMNCPFIFACKDYNFHAERSPDCSTYREILERAAQELKKGRNSTAKKINNETMEEIS